MAGAVARYLSSLTDDLLTEATPHALESLALETATVNRVNTRGKSGTPNFLLYKDCAANHVDYNIFDTDWTEVPGSSGSGNYVISVCLMLVSIITSFGDYV